MADAPKQSPLVWTTSQRRAILILLLLFGGVLAYRYFTRPRYLPETFEADGPRQAELLSQIDPNTADWQTLAAIPNLGEKRAKAIVTYRETQSPHVPDGIVFKSVDDLRNVRGIGPATAQNLKPFLLFPH
jgi:DNA uptake protein ComE-like DNA-binding protein